LHRLFVPGTRGLDFVLLLSINVCNEQLGAHALDISNHNWLG